MRRPLLVLALAALAVPVLAAQFSIDAVKAAYLFRFASYVEWPEAARKEGSFVIGLVGGEDIAVHLEKLLKGRSIKDRPAGIRRVQKPADLEGVHILYVDERAFRGSRPLRALAIAKPILIVTDHHDGLDGGGVINFIEQDRNLRFEISIDAADRSGLKIDSALLSVAARVDSRRTK
jgi:hypothetical protein